jgi:hypothetical protein
MNICKKIKLIGPILGLALLANTASASLLIEPHLGYNLHASGDASSHEYSYNGAEVGARVGFQQLGLMGGLDFTHSAMNLDDKFAGATRNSDYSRNEVGLFVGYNFPILVRAWGAYYFKSKAKADSGDYLKGNTFELGAGFTALPFLSLNVMYRMVSWDERSYSGVVTNPSLKTNEIVLGVSLPLNL